MKMKNFAATVIMSVLPGLGHLYLGLSRRGIQLMIGAFVCIAFIPVLPMVFPFALTVLWFFSFFDALKRLTIINNYVRYFEERAIEDSIPSLSTVSPFSSLDEEVIYFRALNSKRVQGEIGIGIVLVIAGGILFTKFISPPLWSWMSSREGATLLLASVLVLYGLVIIIKRIIPSKKNKMEHV
ncbi:hypothetical protein [Metabacillus sp. RGM 3146]|uniref:hypothetical protein n=1 Tax=Metabacillus sp. RGM 3146 TaxID=3401092 RepID=UPI003B9900EC